MSFAEKMPAEPTGWNAACQPESQEEILPLVYDELRRMAAKFLRSEHLNHPLEPTALVHEAYIRLTNLSDLQWSDREHFLSIAANIMRRVLIDHARSRLANKRGGEMQRLSLEDAIHLSDGPNVDLLELDDALKKLAQIDRQQCEIVEMRFFGGLTIDETASVVGISPATVKREWLTAKNWLYRAMKFKSS
jgi:RNA polymerase sigma factor (TIGR02999 family)